jgi:hypothetical protein
MQQLGICRSSQQPAERLLYSRMLREDGARRPACPEEEVHMNRWIRQIHRWLSILFTIGMIANIINIFVMGQEQPAVWVGMMALIPLILLLLTGLYLFALPYIARGGNNRRITPAE